MEINTPPPLAFALPDGSSLALHGGRFNERQRRLRLELPKSATCWDYAALIDVVRYEPGFETHRFTGKTALQWMTDLRIRNQLDEGRFKRWYEQVIHRVLETLARRPRVPDNHYCVELAAPPLKSSLTGFIHALGLKRASVEQWRAPLQGLTLRGLKPKELKESGVVIRLQHLPVGSILTRAALLSLIDLSHVVPKFACESRFGFVATAGWNEVCQRIPEKQFKRRGLRGGATAAHGTSSVTGIRLLVGQSFAAGTAICLPSVQTGGRCLMKKAA